MEISLYASGVYVNGVSELGFSAVLGADPDAQQTRGQRGFGTY
jgi:hypothetical protein